MSGTPDHFPMDALLKAFGLSQKPTLMVFASLIWKLELYMVVRKLERSSRGILRNEVSAAILERNFSSPVIPQMCPFPQFVTKASQDPAFFSLPVIQRSKPTGFLIYWSVLLRGNRKSTKRFYNKIKNKQIREN